MSKSLAPVTISATGGGQLILPGDPGGIIAIDLYNASPVDLQVNGLPEGSVWLPINRGVVLDMTGGIASNISFAAGQNPNLTSGTSTVLVTVYMAGDTVPPFGFYYVGRNTNVGNQVSTTTGTATTANQLQGLNQSLSVTQADDNNSLGGAYDRNSILVPTVVPGLAHDSALELANVKATGMVQVGAYILGGQLYIPNLIAKVNGVVTAGSFGVPIIVADSGVVNVGNTSATNILSYTPASDGLFELVFGMRVANGTSGNVVNVKVTYNDRFSNSAQTRSLTVAGNTTIFNTNNGITFANGDYDGLAQAIPAKAGTPIVLVYRDPTNTPNDFVNAVLKQIGA